MQDKPVALVTGANQGIGSQIARDLAGHGFTVLVGSRDRRKGDIVASQIGADAHVVQLDVTDRQSIEAAAERISTAFGRLDVLVNNAGISKTGDPDRPLERVAASGRLGTAPLDALRTIWETNVFGVIAVTQAMLPLLRAAPAGRIVNVSSITGSLTWSTAPGNSYREMFGSYAASKAALNAITFGFAADLEGTNIKVNAACPGFTKTNLNNYRRTGSRAASSSVPVPR